MSLLPCCPPVNDQDLSLLCRGTDTCKGVLRPRCDGGPVSGPHVVRRRQPRPSQRDDIGKRKPFRRIVRADATGWAEFDPRKRFDDVFQEIVQSPVVVCCSASTIREKHQKSAIAEGMA